MSKRKASEIADGGSSAEGGDIGGSEPSLRFASSAAAEAGIGHATPEESDIDTTAGTAIRALLAGKRARVSSPLATKTKDSAFLELRSLKTIVQDRGEKIQPKTPTCPVRSRAKVGEDNRANSAPPITRAGKRPRPMPSNPLLRLHNEILDFADFISPTKSEMLRRRALVTELKQIVKDLWGSDGVRLEVFGSTLTGLALPTSDVDMVVFDAPHAGSVRPLRELAKELKRRKLVSYIEVIGKARVPIIKLHHIKSDLDADICFDQPGGLQMASLIKTMLDSVPAMRPLILVMKYFLVQRELNETYRGGVGSFMLQLMVIACMQQHARERCYDRWQRLEAAKRSGKGNRFVKIVHEQIKGENPHNLGMMLMEFIGFYGVQLDFERVGISVRQEGRLYRKIKRGWFNPRRPGLLSIENPEDTSHDIGQNAYNISKVRSALYHSYHLLSRRLDAADRGEGRRNESLLGIIIDIKSAIRSALTRQKSVGEFSAGESDADEDAE